MINDGDGENELGSSRPAFQYGGKSYLRHGGRWIDAATRLRVSENLANKLDFQAQRDLALWGQCKRQDSLDEAPEGRRVLTAGPDQIRWGRSGASRRRSLSRKGPHRSNRRNDLDFEFSSGDLRVKCDLATQWRRTDRDWCVRTSGVVELPGGHSLRVTLALTEDTFGPWQRRYLACHTEPDAAADVADEPVHPEFEPTEGNHGWIRFSLAEAKCCVSIALLDASLELNPDLPWRVKDGPRRFRWAEHGLYARPARLMAGSAWVARPFQLEITAALSTPPHAQPAAQYEHDTPMPSAGLPSLGKRR